MKPIHVSLHAKTRYLERVRPTLTLDSAGVELERLIEMAGAPVSEKPACIDGSNDADAWLTIAPGIVCPLMDTGRSYQVCSVLTHAGLGDDVRRARNERKRKARAQKRARNQQRNLPDRREVSPLKRDAA